MDDAALLAEKIRASRGNFEAEVSCTGEAGLQESLILCDKNPGHKQFIPVNNFSIEHIIPTGYHDDHVVDYVKATIDITCRVEVPSISSNRPDYWPESKRPFPFAAHKGTRFMVTGTGWVSRVDKYTEEHNMDCVCKECRSGTQTPKKRWGKIAIKTACHVVFNTEEATDGKCQFQFFYNSPETDVSKVRTLRGLEVVSRNIKGDSCEMEYVTHDVKLLDTFYTMWNHWRKLHSEVAHKFRSDDKNVREDICIIVSHPHGCYKQVSIGTKAQRYLVTKYDSGEEQSYYGYNTPTCPGSSGALIITLWRHNRRTGRLCKHAVHSEGGPGNDNYSGDAREWVS